MHHIDHKMCGLSRLVVFGDREFQLHVHWNFGPYSTSIGVTRSLITAIRVVVKSDLEPDKSDLGAYLK